MKIKECQIVCYHKNGLRDFEKTEELYNYCLNNYEWFKNWISEEESEENDEYEEYEKSENQFLFENGIIKSCGLIEDSDFEDFEFLKAQAEKIIEITKAINIEKLALEVMLYVMFYKGEKYYFAVVIQDGKLEICRKYFEIENKLDSFLSEKYEYFREVFNYSTIDCYKGLFKNRKTGELVKLGQLLIDRNGNPNFSSICKVDRGIIPDDITRLQPEFLYTGLTYLSLPYYNVMPKNYLEKINSCVFGTVDEWEFIGYDKGCSFFDEIENSGHVEIREIQLDSDTIYKLKTISESEFLTLMENETEKNLSNEIEEGKAVLKHNITETVIFDLSEFRQFLKTVMYGFELHEDGTDEIFFYDENNQLYGCTDSRNLRITYKLNPKNNYDFLIKDYISIDFRLANTILLYETDETEIQIGSYYGDVFIKIGDLCLMYNSKRILAGNYKIDTSESITISREKLKEEFRKKSELQIFKDHSNLKEVFSNKYKGLSYLVETDANKNVSDTSKYYECYHRDTLLMEKIIEKSNVSKSEKLIDFGPFVVPVFCLPVIYELVEKDDIVFKYIDNDDDVLVENDNTNIIIKRQQPTFEEFLKMRNML